MQGPPEITFMPNSVARATAWAESALDWSQMCLMASAAACVTIDSVTCGGVMTADGVCLLRSRHAPRAVRGVHRKDGGPACKYAWSTRFPVARKFRRVVCHRTVTSVRDSIDASGRGAEDGGSSG